MEKVFVPTTAAITNACMFLNKEDYQAAEKSVCEAIDNIMELVANNDLPRDDEAICDLTQAAAMMRKALTILVTYQNVTV